MDNEELEIVEEQTVDHVSFSQMSMCARCPMQWYHRYVEGKKIPPGIALVRGSSYHKALEVNFKQKIDTGNDLSCSELCDIFVTDFDKRTTEEEVIKLPDDSPNEYKDSGVKMVQAYHASDIMKTLQPVSVEQTYLADVPGLSKPIMAVIDLEVTDGRLIDHKTSKSKWSEDKWRNDHQSTTYAIVKELDTVKFEFHVAVATKNPYIQQVPVTRGPEHKAWWIRNMQGLMMEMDLVKSGAFIAKTDGWWCSPNYCGYYNECMPHGSGKIFSIGS